MDDLPRAAALDLNLKKIFTMQEKCQISQVR